MCKGKEERSECKIYSGIRLLNVVEKIYMRILEGLIDDEGVSDQRGGVQVKSSPYRRYLRKHVRKSKGCMWVLCTWRRFMI